MIYFASDTHLGLSSPEIDVRKKETQFVNWLKSLDDCTELFLVGDIFDFWYEYRYVIPKGFVRLFGQLAKMSDSGVKIHFFCGNHDLWHQDYFEKELGIQLHYSQEVLSLNGRRVLVSHGDVLAGVHTLIGKIFRSRILRWPYERIVHPDLSMKFGFAWSLHNRMSRSLAHEFRGEDEPMVKSARQVLKKDPDLDYIVCGHIHIPLEYPLNDRTKLIVLGQWVVGDPVFAKMDTDGCITLQSLS